MAPRPSGMIRESGTLLSNSERLGILIVEQFALVLAKGEVLNELYHIPGVLKGVVAAEEDTLQAQHLPGTGEGLLRHVSTCGDIDIMAEVIAEIMLVLRFWIG